MPSNLQEWHGRVREVHVHETGQSNRKFGFWLTGEGNPGTGFSIPYNPEDPGLFNALSSTILCAASQNWWIEVSGESANKISIVGVKLTSAFVM
jgi:hypothetical protein